MLKNQSRREIASLMRLFSSYEEYQEYLYDFYGRDWSSVEQHFGEDVAHSLGQCLDQCEEYCSIRNDLLDEDVDGDQSDMEDEELYVKNRTSRSQRRKNAMRARKHDENIAFILSKKAFKEATAVYEIRQHKPYAKRLIPWKKRVSRIQAKCLPTQQVAENVSDNPPSEPKRHPAYFNRTVEVATSGRSTLARLSL